MKAPARQRILETADRLFSARGYGNVGINEIIDRSGTAKASFYAHFPSKLALCAAWLEKRHAHSAAEWAGVLGGTGAVPEKMMKLLDGLKAFLEGSEFRGCPFTNTAGFLGAEAEATRVHALIARHKEQHREFFIDLARQMTTPTRATRLGAALFLLYSGATMESQNARAVWPVDAARAGAKLLFKSLA
ncbi:MAG: TetR/AcrR family transcriptional regulator [Opitutales bacterium]